VSIVDITAIVNMHSEGMLAQASLRSVQAAKQFAERQGLSVEVLIVLDRPDQKTEEYVRDCPVVDFRSITTTHGDLGLARNSGVEAARGRWIGFLDADDLWGNNWLASAHAAAAAERRDVVWHPSVSMYFGMTNRLFVHVDMEDSDFDLSMLAMTNYWTALSFASRELFLSVPYSKSRIDLQLGYEDWNWNCETIANGILHKCVPDTAHIIRERPLSLLRRTNAAQSLMSPSSLFRKSLGRGVFDARIDDSRLPA